MHVRPMVLLVSAGLLACGARQTAPPECAPEIGPSALSECIRERVGSVNETADGLEVLFEIHAAGYVLHRGHPRFEQCARDLRRAMKSGRAIAVRADGTTILSVTR